MVDARVGYGQDGDRLLDRRGQIGRLDVRLAELDGSRGRHAVPQVLVASR